MYVDVTEVCEDWGVSRAQGYKIIKQLNERMLAINPNLIVLSGNEELERKLPAKTIRLNNKLKRKILEKGGADVENPGLDKIKQRIFISYNANIFNFTGIGFVSS